MADDNDRQLDVSWSKVEHYLRRGLDVTFSMNGLNTPRIDYVVLGQEIELRVDLVGHRGAPVSKMPMIRIDEVVNGNSRMARLRTAEPALLRDFHDLICAISERMVIHGQPLEEALAETLRAWRTLMSGPRLMQHQRVIGLFGELAVLWTLGMNEQVGWRAAADAWLSAAREEHDFALPEYDVEVKTTSLSNPVHTIHGASQLTPKPNRPLWLVSLQVTRGGGAGVSLSELAQVVRRKLTMQAPHRLIELDQALALVGWQRPSTDEDRWLLAKSPQLFAVKGDFPRIDAAFLNTLPSTTMQRVDLITYSIDLTGFPEEPNRPAVLTGICLPNGRTD